MLNDVVEVRPLENHRVFLRFDDGQAGEIDLAPLLAPFDGVFELLKDHGYFAQVRVDADSGTIVWPNGADLCPDVLRHAMTGEPLPSMQNAAVPAK